MTPEHGQVVKLDSAATDRPTAGTGESAARRRQQRSKTALVLGGGGFTGGVYKIGALRALDLLSVNRSVTQLDVYLGIALAPLSLLRWRTGSPQRR